MNLAAEGELQGSHSSGRVGMTPQLHTVFSMVQML